MHDIAAITCRTDYPSASFLRKSFLGVNVRSFQAYFKGGIDAPSLLYDTSKLVLTAITSRHVSVVSVLYYTSLWKEVTAQALI